jgi:hypothetical protein
MYVINLKGAFLHYYGQGVYGWGERSSTTGQLGQLVQFSMRDEAEHWMDTRSQFSRGAVVQAKPDIKTHKVAGDGNQEDHQGHQSGQV